MDKVLEFFQGDELASKVWKNKYKFGDEQTPKDMFERHIKEIAEKEFQRLKQLYLISQSNFEKLSEYGKKRHDSYFDSKFDLQDKILENLRNQLNFNAIVLGGSPMQGIGNHKMFSSLSNCFFVGRPYDSYSGINRKEDEIAQLMKRRGGAGVDLSSIRPNGAKVHNQASTSSGVVPFAEGYSAKTKQVAQYGRRGALMISLCMQHPDSLEFIMSKQQEGVMTGANISVIIPDDFMEAVVNDTDYILRFPVDLNIINESIIIEDFNYNELYAIDKGIYIKKIHAKEYWQTLIECAHKTAEPGILFSGNWMKGGTDWVYEQFRPIGTNPCFTGDMMLLTEDGEISFYDLARKCEVEFKERGKFCLNLINKENEIVAGRVWQTGMKKIITLQLDNGKIISCTANHIFLADGQECKAIDTEGKFLEGFSNESYKVVNIIDTDEQEIVYDFELKGAHSGKCSDNDDICHWGIVQDVIAHNCSEIPMSEYDACRLLARNLYTLVKNPFTLESELLSDDELYSAFYEQMIIGDLLVDLEFDYIDRIIEKIKSGNDPEDLKQSEINIWYKIVDKAKQGRRCGAGFTGFGDMLAALGLPYYSPEVTEKVFKIKMKAELDATIDMSIQFGSFIGFDDQLEKTAIYNIEVISKEFPEQYARMLEFGRRNVSWATGAPVGTGSMMVQTTSGVEPLFLPFLERKLKCILPTDRVDYIDPADKQAYSLNYVMHPKFITWYVEYYKKSNGKEIDFITAKEFLENIDKTELDLLFGLSPWFGSCANDIDYQKRVEIQAIVQKYTTHAISSTINLPEDVKIETIDKIYMMSWKSGLKGNTVYRDGSRSGIINSIKEYKEIVENDFEPIFGPKRPKIIPAHYHTLKYKKKTYSVIIGFYKERPFEVFIISGINDIPEVFDEFEDFILGETIKDNENWYNFESDTFTVREISDVEGEEKMLSLMLSGLFRSRTPIEKIIKILNKLQPIAGNFTHRLIKILSHYIDVDIDNDEKCPECGEKLRHENGCVICVNGHSKC